MDTETCRGSSSLCATDFFDDLFAHGDDVLTTVTVGQSPWGEVDGTSFAAPLVAETAGKLFALHPELEATEVKALLIDSAGQLEDGPGRALDRGRAFTRARERAQAPALGTGDPGIIGQLLLNRRRRAGQR